MTPRDQPSDLLDLLRSGNNEAFEQLYQKYYRQAAAFVLSNSGNEQDARDVFQEALLVLFKKTRNDDFRLTADLGAFLHAIVRNRWLYRLRTQRAHPETATEELSVLPDRGGSEMELLLSEQNLEDKHRVVKQLLETLKTECQKLIEYAYYYQLPASEIAGLLGYTELFVKVKKHRCMEALREKVKNHPMFNDEK